MGFSEFLQSRKNSGHVVSKFFMCISAPSWSSDTALPVTCMVRWRMLLIWMFIPQDVLSLVPSYVGGLCFLFPPIRFSSSRPFFYDTSVFVDRCPHTRTGVFAKTQFYIGTFLFHAWISQTHMGEVSPPFPHCQKENACFVFLLEFWGELHLSSHIGS